MAKKKFIETNSKNVLLNRGDYVILKGGDEVEGDMYILRCYVEGVWLSIRESKDFKKLVAILKSIVAIY